MDPARGRPALPGQEEESGIWSPGACEGLTDVAFAQAAGSDPLRPWTMTSKDGRVYVVFTPDGHKDVDGNMGMVAMHHRQRYGRCRGTLVTQGSTRHLVDDPGVLEAMKARL